MDYREAERFLYSLNNIPRREYLSGKIPRRNNYLRRLELLLGLLGHPEKKIPRYIHVSGTSGKGSVCLLLSSILRARGKKVGLLTSPHPSLITERFEINGRVMPRADFARVFSLVKKQLDIYSAAIREDLPSFYEILTALGIYYFAEQKVDWAVVEVGLGGRHDSTNILPKKDVAIITHIAKDHLDIIGPTKKDVAREKAGIIKKAGRVFTMEKDPALLQIIAQECRKNKAPLIKINGNDYVLKKESLERIDFIYKNTNFHLKTLGRHQIKNAIMAIETGRYLEIPEKQIAAGLAKTAFPLRFEVIKKKPIIVLDGAHNTDKMKTTIEAVKRLRQRNEAKQMHIVAGFSQDKDVQSMLRQISSLRPATFAATRSTINPYRKVASPARLAESFKKMFPRCRIKIFLDPKEAYTWSEKQAKKDDLILVTGSFFLSGELKIV